MPQLAAITLNDGKTPTVEAHVFNPIATFPIAELRRNGVAGLAQFAQERLSLSVKQALKAQEMNRVKIQISLPVQESVSTGNANGYVAPPAIAYENRGYAELVFSPRSTKEQRRDTRVLLANALLNAAIAAMSDDLEGMY